MVVPGDLADEGFEAAAVRDGAVEEPFGATEAECGQVLSDELDGRDGFGNFSVGAVDAGYVPVCAVSCDKKHTSAYRRFNCYQDVITVNGKLLVPDG